MAESGTEESGWTKENLQKLLAVMKTSIPENERKHTYIRALKTMDWNMVAFPPFSPEACKEKWGQILQKMVKIRSLTELLVEAEGVISNPLTNIKIHPEHPKRPAPPNAIFLEENRQKYLKKHPNMSRQKVFKKLVQKYQMLPDEEKAQYEKKFELANAEYIRRVQVFSERYRLIPKCKTFPKSVSAITKPVRDQRSISKKVTKETEGMPLQPPLNGYRLYCKEQRSSKKGLEGNNCIATWAQGWRDMTEKQRNTFNTRSAELRRQYNVELDAYLMNFDAEKQQQILNQTGVKTPKKSTDNKRKRIMKIPGEPKMPSRSVPGSFCKKQMLLLREKIPNSRGRFAVVNKMWADLPMVQKTCYEKEVLEENRKYSVVLQKWFETLPAADQQLYQRHNPSKSKYLDFSHMEVYELHKPCGSVYRPSDSEDEDTTDSSDDEENYVECVEVEEEEEDNDDIVFEIF